MERIGKYLRRASGPDGRTGIGYAHWCPACKETHAFAVDRPFSNGAKWSFDGNIDAPTFAPSMNIGIGPFPDGHIERCHYFLKGGQLQYISDCTHAMAGQTVPLPELPEGL